MTNEEKYPGAYPGQYVESEKKEKPLTVRQHIEASLKLIENIKNNRAGEYIKFIGVEKDLRSALLKL